MTGCTLLLYLSDLFHSFLQNCTFVRLDIEVVDVVEVGEDQLGELFDVFVLVLAVALFVTPLWATGGGQRTLRSENESNREDSDSRRETKSMENCWVNIMYVKSNSTTITE